MTLACSGVWSSSYAINHDAIYGATLQLVYSDTGKNDRSKTYWTNLGKGNLLDNHEVWYLRTQAGVDLV